MMFSWTLYDYNLVSWLLWFPDEVTCNFLPDCVKSELEQACHALPWSRDDHLTLSLDSPLWKELGNFKIPEPQVHVHEYESSEFQVQSRGTFRGTGGVSPSPLQV